MVQMNHFAAHIKCLVQALPPKHVLCYVVHLPPMLTLPVLPSLRLCPPPGSPSSPFSPQPMRDMARELLSSLSSHSSIDRQLAFLVASQPSAMALVRAFARITALVGTVSRAPLLVDTIHWMLPGRQRALMAGGTDEARLGSGV